MIKRIEGATRTLGKSQGYLGLPIRDEVTSGGIPRMVSAWEPTPEEIETIKAGGTIYLTVLGAEHPPVKIEVLK